MTTPASCRFIVRGVPKPSPRPRARAFKTKKGTYVGRVYDGGDDDDWKSLVCIAAREAWGDRPVEMGAALLYVDFIFLRPKSVSVKKRPYHTTKPDLDNLVKSVKDAMTGLVWKDDSQVVTCRSRKEYCEQLDLLGTPSKEWTGAIVQVTFLDPPAA